MSAIRIPRLRKTTLHEVCIRSVFSEGWIGGSSGRSALPGRHNAGASPSPSYLNATYIGDSDMELEVDQIDRIGLPRYCCLSYPTRRPVPAPLAVLNSHTKM